MVKTLKNHNVVQRLQPANTVAGARKQHGSWLLPSKWFPIAAEQNDASESVSGKPYAEQEEDRRICSAPLGFSLSCDFCSERRPQSEVWLLLSRCKAKSSPELHPRRLLKLPLSCGAVVYAGTRSASPPPTSCRIGTACHITDRKFLRYLKNKMFKCYQDSFFLWSQQPHQSLHCYCWGRDKTADLRLNLFPLLVDVKMLTRVKQSAL